MRSGRPGGHPADRVSQTGGQIPPFCLWSRHVSPIPHTHTWWVAGFALLCSMQERKVYSPNSRVWCYGVGTTWSRGKWSSGMPSASPKLDPCHFPAFSVPTPLNISRPKLANWNILTITSHSAVSMMWQLSLHTLSLTHILWLWSHALLYCGDAPELGLAGMIGMTFSPAM